MLTTLRFLFLLMLGLLGFQPFSYAYDADGFVSSAEQCTYVPTTHSHVSSAETVASVPLCLDRDRAASASQANMRPTENSIAAESSVTASGIQEGATVYRVFGDEARALGRSWTTVAPDAVSDFRAAAGLYDTNSADYVIMARLKSLDNIESVLPANPGPTTPPGALQVPEVLFKTPPVPGKDIEIISGGGWSH